MKKRAFISGINGQDSSYLCEHLLNLDYDIYGIVRRHSTSESQTARIEHIVDKLNIDYGDVACGEGLDRLFRKIQPDEIYNLAAMSHVRVSFDIPKYTVEANAIGTLNMLEAYKNNCPKAKFYMASSSEMYGITIDPDGFQRETTLMNPTSPYGCSKVFAYNLCRHYRRAYNLFISNGILFNHESPRRGSNFVSAKVVKTACQIKLGLTNKLELGNLDSYRDWGHSKDYTKLMIKILNHTEPDDFVIATGETRSVRDLCKVVFDYLDMDYEDYVIINEKFLRAEELPYLKGDSSKARKILDWKPTYTFESMIHEMCDHWLDVLQGKKSLR